MFNRAQLKASCTVFIDNKVAAEAEAAPVEISDEEVSITGQNIEQAGSSPDQQAQSVLLPWSPDSETIVQRMKALNMIVRSAKFLTWRPVTPRTWRQIAARLDSCQHVRAYWFHLVLQYLEVPLLGVTIS